MAYYVRAFCTSPEIPTLRQVLEWAAQQRRQLAIDPEFAEVDLDSPEWRQVGLIYEDGKQSFWSEVDRDDGSEDSPVREEVGEFMEELDEVEDSEEKRRVIQHLRNTTFIVANQVPTSDFDDDGYRALSTYLGYFVEHCGAMVQADGEGFYEGDKLIVAQA